MNKVLITATVIIKIIFLDLILPILDKLLQGYHVYLLVTEDHIYWACAAGIILLLPGFAELVYWLVIACQGTESNADICKWITFYNPITFHFGAWLK